MTYTTAEYHRVFGLCNKLFPWSRAKIMAARHDLRFLRQTWVSIRGGAVIRGGIDYLRFPRKIFLFDNFKDSSDEFSRWRAIFKSRIGVETLASAAPHVNTDGVLVFKARAPTDFSEFDGQQNFLGCELRRITKDKWLRLEQNLPSQFIGINIRWGNDFKAPDDESVGYRKTHIDWYVTSLKKLRNHGITCPALIFSDAPSSIAGHFSSCTNVCYASTNAAVADLLLLSRAEIILGCGSSSFSAWAAFLSSAPFFSSRDTPFDAWRLPAPTRCRWDIARLFE